MMKDLSGNRMSQQPVLAGEVVWCGWGRAGSR